MTADQIILAAEMDGTSISRNQAEELSRLNACTLLEVDGKLMLCLTSEGVEMDFVENVGEWNVPDIS